MMTATSSFSSPSCRRCAVVDRAGPAQVSVIARVALAMSACIAPHNTATITMP